ncbi:hypothetical protein XENOCAPTIV_028581 [Xenoophorus captivus]|uniref:C2 domain-containing protein n=1 Tax=Xenoophorus captivus TaxID=1517983 RepID=A0ABV0S1J5_9TELE
MSMAMSTSSLQSSKVSSIMSIYSESGDFDSVEVSGDVIFSVKYDEHTQSLHVFIKQCQGLAYGDASRLLTNPRNAFLGEVEVLLDCKDLESGREEQMALMGKPRSTKRKTAIVKKNLNPQYNTTFVYKELSLEQLRGMCLELTVWDREAMLSNEFLGGVCLSSGKGTVKIGKEEVEPESVGEEINLWQKMMQYPDSWAEGTLPLRSTMGKTKTK